MNADTKRHIDAAQPVIKLIL